MIFSMQDILHLPVKNLIDNFLMIAVEANMLENAVSTRAENAE